MIYILSSFGYCTKVFRFVSQEKILFKDHKPKFGINLKKYKN